MNFAVIALSVMASLILLLGLAVILRPRIFSHAALYVVQPWGIRAAAAIRLFAAIILWLAAPASRWPQAFQGLAVLALVTGVAVLVVAPHRIKSMVDWVVARPARVLRLFGVLAMIGGGFILWALAT